jgi:hypothetical protein
VEITILKDPDKPATKDNTEKKEFPAIETFTGSGATTVIVLKRLQTEVFEHLGISNDNTKVADRLDYLLQVTTGRARDQLVNIFKQGRQQFADLFDVPSETARAFVRDKNACARPSGMDFQDQCRISLIRRMRTTAWCPLKPSWTTCTVWKRKTSKSELKGRGLRTP